MSTLPAGTAPPAMNVGAARCPDCGGKLVSRHDPMGPGDSHCPPCAQKRPAAICRANDLYGV